MTLSTGGFRGKQTPLLCCLYFEFDCLNLSVLLAEFVVVGRIFSRIP